MSRRVPAILAGLIVLAAIAWWVWPGTHRTDLSATPAPAPKDSDVTSAASASIVGGASLPKFETRLLPHDGLGAEPSTVRLGVAHVAPDQRRAYERWVLAGEGGAGPATYSELAQVGQWLTPPAASREDNTVVVGPVSLPPADRFVLQASSRNPLLFHRASFTADAPPATITPTLAAGLTVLRSSMSESRARLLFRRVGGASDLSGWHALLAEQAPELLAAFDEAGLVLSQNTQFAPLPTGPVDLVLRVDGVEAERRRVELVAGTWTEVRFDEVSEAVARAVSVDLELALVIARTSDPVEGIRITWHAENGDQPRTSDAQGRVRFDHLDRQRMQRFTLQFPATTGKIPIWPETRPLELSLDEEANDDERALIRKTIVLTPLRWLEVRTGNFPMPVHRQGGQPYPIFVLQQEREGQWIDVASDHFIPVPGGLAVSVQQDGRHRIMALQSPWSVRYSSIAIIEPHTEARNRVDLLPSAGHSVEITLTHEGSPLTNTPVALLGPARGLPAIVLTTDAAGGLLIEGATEPDIGLEVAGYIAERVDLRSTLATVDVTIDPDASSNQRDF